MRIRTVTSIPKDIQMNYHNPYEDDSNVAMQAKILRSLAKSFNSSTFMKLRYGSPHVKLENTSRIWRFRINDNYYAALEYVRDELFQNKEILLWLDYTNTSLEERKLVYSHFIDMFTEEMKKIRQPRFVRNKRGLATLNE